MVDRLKNIVPLLGSRTEPLFVPLNIDNWDETDSASIAQQIFDELDKLPLALLPGTPRHTRKTEYKELIVSQVIGSVPLPAIQLLVTKQEVSKYTHIICSLSIPKLVEYIKNELKQIHQARETVLTKLGNIVECFVSGTRQYLIEHKQKELEKLEKQKMAEKNLPHSLQPKVMPFDKDSVAAWLEHVRSVYSSYEIPDNNIVKYVGQFLPDHLKPTHENLKSKQWADYKKDLLDFAQADTTGVSTRMRMLRLRKQDKETTIEFILRAHAIAANEATLTEKEKVKILIEIMPAEDASLVINAGCATVKDLVSRLSDALQNKELVRKQSASQGNEEMALRIQQLERKLEEKMTLQAPVENKVENKILALLENFGKEPEKTLEERVLEKLEKFSKSSEKKEPTVEEKVDQVWAVFNSNRGGRGRGRGGYNRNFGRGFGRGNGRGYFQGYQGNYNTNSYIHPQQQGPSNYQQQHYNRMSNQGYNQGYYQPNNQVAVYGGGRGGRGGGFQDRPRGACFGCQSLEHQIAQCPNLQNFRRQ